MDINRRKELDKVTIKEIREHYEKIVKCHLQDFEKLVHLRDVEGFQRVADRIKHCIDEMNKLDQTAGLPGLCR